MKNKGFTLVELVAIIVIFATIFLVTFPNLINLGKGSKEREYNNMVDTLCLAGKSYIYSNIDDFPEISNAGSKIEVDIETLILNEYVERDIKNPKTKSNINSDKLIYKILNDNSLKCEYVEGR